MYYFYAFSGLDWPEAQRPQPVHLFVRPFIRPFLTYERYILKSNEPVSMQIGARGDQD